MLVTVVKKKTALDALGAIEQCFANLKEKYRTSYLLGDMADNNVA